MDRRRVQDVGAGAVLILVLFGGWYIWSLGVLVYQHEIVVQALIRGGVVRLGPAQPPQQQGPTGEPPK